MKNLTWLRLQVTDWIEDISDTDIIDRAINTAIMSVSSVCSFSQLTELVDVTPDENGILYVPPRCQDIVDIYPSSDKPEADYVFTGARRVQADGRKPGYFFRSVGVTEVPLAEVTCDVTQGSNIVQEGVSNQVPFTADMIGEEFVVAGGTEVYRIDAFDDSGAVNTITVYPAYRFTTVADVPCMVRPEGTEMLSLFDSLGNIYQSEVTIEFHKHHPQLVRERDILFIPAPNTVALEAVRFFLRQTKYDVDAERLERKYTEFKNSECSKQPAKSDSNYMQNGTLFSPPLRGRRR